MYRNKLLLIDGLKRAQDAGDRALDACLDADAQKVLLLAYRKDPEKREEGFMVYQAATTDSCMRPFRFYPVLTGDAYQEQVYPDWIWSANLKPQAIYFDTGTVWRIDLKTGKIKVFVQVLTADNPELKDLTMDTP